MATFTGTRSGGGRRRRATPAYVRGPSPESLRRAAQRQDLRPAFTTALPVALSFLVGSALVLLAMVAWAPGGAAQPDTGPLSSLDGVAGAAIAPAR